jgi:hypothetical protein
VQVEWVCRADSPGQTETGSAVVPAVLGALFHTQVCAVMHSGTDLFARLACIIHESSGFVNKHPQQIENFVCGFRQGAFAPAQGYP